MIIDKKFKGLVKEDYRYVFDGEYETYLGLSKLKDNK